MFGRQSETDDKFFGGLSWLEPDIILPSQLSNKNPLYMSQEQLLAEQLLWFTLEDLRQCFRPVKSRIFKYKRTTRREILDWIFTDPRNPKKNLNISLICDALDINLPKFRKMTDILSIMWSYSAGEYPILYYKPSREDSGGHKTGVMSTSTTTKYKKSSRHRIKTQPKLDWIARFK